MESSKKKVYILSSSFPYSAMMEQAGFKVVYSARDADLVLFTGGEDVSPHLYNEPQHPKTFCSMTRDVIEKNTFEYCVKNLVPMVGICRGGQFLNVMNGGKMYQHVTEHTTSHTMTDVASGEEIFVSSTHHQMMRPSKNAEIVAVAKQGGTKEYMGSDDKIKTVNYEEPDFEVIFYPDTDSLCFQPHPEFYQGIDTKFKGMHDYFFSLIKEFFYMEGVK